MKRTLTLLISLVVAGYAAPNTTSGIEPLPAAVSNNAVAILRLHGEFKLFSVMGMGPQKTWNAVSSAAYEVDARSGKSKTIHSVPGTAGRVGAMAAGAEDRVYLFGGYVLFQGGGMAVPDANFYDLTHDSWLRLSDTPTAVGDAVVGVYRDRYIYLIGGRSNGRLVSDVQIYDVQKNRWLKGTSSPGPAVFGHAGALVDDTIVYVDGARAADTAGGPKFVASDECWKGKIDHHDPTKIAWSKLPNHPGNARFRIAGGGSDRDGMIYFAGGSDNPYDFNGVGYDGKPAEPSPWSFAFHVHSGQWKTLDDNTPDPTMDHRGLLVTPEGLVTLGGMDKGQQVTGRIEVLAKTPKTNALR